MQYSKVKIISVVEDKAQVYDDNNKPIEGKTENRIRATVIPVKPDPITVNLTRSGDEIINTFKALQGKTVLFPARLGVTDSGSQFLILLPGFTSEDIDLIPEKPISQTSVDSSTKPLFGASSQASK